MISDNIQVKGLVSLALVKECGDTVDVTINNLVVTSGKNFIAQCLASAQTYMSHMAVGTGTTAAAVANTTLVTEVGRVAITSTTPNANTVVYAATFGPGQGTGAITEAGVFNASSAGTMLARTVFPVLNKAAGDSLTITWQLTIS